MLDSKPLLTVFSMLKKCSLLIASLFFLTACTGNWTLDVDLSEEQRKQLESAVAEFQFKIKNYEPDAIFYTPEPPIPFWVELARAQEGLGKLKDALKTYQDAQLIYPRSQAIENNLGRLYEKAQDYEKAAQQYLHVYEEFKDKDYLNDVTRVYIKAKDLVNAEKYFNAWKLETKDFDSALEQSLEKLREELGER